MLTPNELRLGEFGDNALGENTLLLFCASL